METKESGCLEKAVGRAGVPVGTAQEMIFSLFIDSIIF